MTDRHDVTDAARLETLYGKAVSRSIDKEIDHLNAHYRAFVEAAPFVALASAGAGGLDVSPRGDTPGFVTVEDPKTLLLPDRRGNNRIDTLRNIVEDPRVALLFLVPGVGETLRINGRARISIDPALLARFAVDGKPPRSVLVVAVERVYFQCSRAVVRADLWNPAKHAARGTLPSAGEILEALSKDGFDGRAYDAELPARVATSLY
ncbi:MAG: pyridoxamine 5'-phosphate oxidase family protein [Rhodospirillales bacterium]|nr:pyridoxamine 5'-phosphate oxidase family protein [Rhodospirillales bacterium]